MYTDFSHFFIDRTRNLWRIKVRSHLPPHLYFVTALPCKTHATANIDTSLHVWFIDVPICTSDIAVFDMFTVILPNTFNFSQDHDTTRWSYCQWNVVISFLLGDYRPLQQLYHVKFSSMIDTKNAGNNLSKYGISTKLFWVTLKCYTFEMHRYYTSAVCVLLGRVITE